VHFKHLVEYGADDAGGHPPTRTTAKDQAFEGSQNERPSAS
jgi:hypothetical protein